MLLKMEAIAQCDRMQLKTQNSSNLNARIVSNNKLSESF